MTDWIKRHKLHLLLLLGLAVGLTYVFLVPPWMHFDEPGHFEYTWLIANQEKWPEEGDYDQYMRREVAASLMEHRFDEYTVVSFGITQIYEPVSLLISQLGDQPLYYFFVSLPLRFVRRTDITLQLYISRLVSLLMFLATIWVSHRVARLIFGADHPISWMLPAFLIAIPSFVDIMTAVNNDVMAILAFSLFVWASVILLLRGFSPLRLLFLIFSVLLCYFSKSTTWLAIPLSFLVLALSIVRGKNRKFVWIGLVVLAIAGMVVSVDWKKTAPSYFVHTGHDQQTFLRVSDEKTLPENHVIKHVGQSFFQMISPEGLEQIKGKSVTFSAWIWADEETEIRFPIIDRVDLEEIILSDQKMQITTEPTQFSASFDMPTDGYAVWLSFFGSKDTAVYWDEIVLKPDNPSEGPRSNELESVNVVRNGSIEDGMPKSSDLVDGLLARVNQNFSTSQILQLFDYQSVGWYLRTDANVVFRGFWGHFGWGAVTLIGKFAYQALVVMSILFGLTSTVSILLRFRSLPKSILFLFLIIVILQLFMVVARGAGSWYSRRYYPTARYFYPAILPLTTFLVYGMYRLLALIQIKNKNATPEKANWRVWSVLAMLYVLSMIIWGIISIQSYYY